MGRWADRVATCSPSSSGGPSCSPLLSYLLFTSLFFALFVDNVTLLKRGEEKGLILNDSGAGNWQGQYLLRRAETWHLETAALLPTSELRS